MALKHKLIEVEWPDFGVAAPPLPPDLAEFETRIAAARSRMEAKGLTHLVVYGDREHFANLAYLTGFDPRFEEALLVIGSEGPPLLVVGNECEGYLPISPLYAAGKLRAERYQTFSLLDQPRDASRLMRDILAGEGIGANAKVGCVGWKYFAEAEHPEAVHAIELPSYLVDTLRDLAGRRNVVNVTAILMSAANGLRTRCSAAEIAFFEYTNVLASEGVKRMLDGLREGMADYEVVALAGINGVPLSCHVTFATGAKRALGLSGPTGEVIRRGEPLSANIAYWGSNCCRAGWIASSAQDLPAAAQDYVENFAGPYFAAMAEWFGLMRIGVSGDEIARRMAELLPYDKYGVALNPGHLIHLDEWVSSPIYLGSRLALQSGMVIQADVIPVSATYSSARVEDGIVLADAGLRRQLEERYPDCHRRCSQRRRFMMEVLGIDLAEEALPLSNLPGLMPPYFLAAHTVFAVA